MDFSTKERMVKQVFLGVLELIGIAAVVLAIVNFINLDKSRAVYRDISHDYTYTSYSGYGSYTNTSYEYYGGDAYTGIQHAAADTADNVAQLGKSVGEVGKSVSEIGKNVSEAGKGVANVESYAEATMNNVFTVGITVSSILLIIGLLIMAASAYFLVKLYMEKLEYLEEEIWSE